MRDTNSGRRLLLKSKLLAGATGLAAATMTTAAFADGAATAPASPPADPPKWSPYAEVGGGIGSGFTAGKVDFFAPVWQDLDTLLYARAGIQLRGTDDKVWNFGLGYRTKVNPDWILGIYGGYDSSDTPNGHTTHQWSAGAELMSEDWDVRVNGYSAPKALRDNNDFALYIHDTTIAILQSQDLAYSGFDGEVGYRVWHDDSTDFRLFAGGYSFSHGDIRNSSGIDFNVRDIQGWKGRAEVNMFDLDGIGPQSRLSFEGEVTHDSARGTGGFVGVTLRIPLGDTGTGAQALDELDRRMADPQRRMENVLTGSGFTKPEPVIIYNGTITSEPTNTLYYVQQQASAGAGTYANPTTLQDATARGPVNQFIVVTDKGGPVVGTGATVQTGETVVGGGQTFEVRGTAHPSAVFSHTFAPGSGTPTITGASSSDPALTVDSGAIVEGMNFAGPFSDAIYGHNVTDVVISNVDIDGTGGGVNGVHFVQDASGNESNTIQFSSIENVSGDGVYQQNDLGDGGTSTQNLHLSDVTITGAGNDGVYISSTVSGGSSATLNLEVTGSTISGSGSADIGMTSTVFGGSTLTSTVTIDPTTVTGGLYGVFAYGVADGGTLNQNVNVTDTNFYGQTVAGVAVIGYAENGGTVNSSVGISNVNVTGSYFPIAAVASAASGGQVTQTVSISNSNVEGGTYDGIDLVTYATGVGSSANQTVSISHVTANDTSFGSGVYAYAQAADGGTAIQTLSIDDLSATHNYFDGVYAGVSASTYGTDPTAAAQYVSIANSHLAGNFIGVGVDASAEGPYGAVRQDVMVTNTVLSDGAHRSPGYEFVGASANAFAFDEGAVQQNLYFIDDTATHAYASGIAISATSLYAGFVEQNAYILGTTGYMNLSHNDGYGVAVSANALSGGDIEQNVGIYYANMSHNGLGGLGVNTTSYGIAVGYTLYYSHVSQNVIAYRDHFDFNGGNGVTVNNYATYGAGIDQFVYVGASTASHNAGSGVLVNSVDTGPSFYGFAPGTHLYSDVYIFNSTLDHNGLDGITTSSSVIMPTNPSYVFGDSYLIQHVVVSGVEADHNARSGFVNYANAAGIYSLNIQYVTLQNSDFSGNGLDGVAFLGSDYFGPYSFGAAIQDVTIVNSNVSHNARDGLYASADSSGFQGRDEQHFTIVGSIFDHNGADGMSFYNHAHDGAYYPGYGCNYVQGVVGGCAFVRQTVQIGYSDISYNGGNGIAITNRAENYGAVYTSSGRPAYTPTLLIEGSNVDGNHGDGLHIYNYLNHYSYGYQYVVALNTVFDGNHGAGISALNNVTGNSLLVQRVVLYGIGSDTGASGNHGDGIDISSNTTEGGKIGNLLVVGYAEVSANGGDGINVSADAYSGAGVFATGVQQYVDIIASDISFNHGYGIDMHSRDVNYKAITYQYLGVVGSSVVGNHNDGVHAFEIAYATSNAGQNLYFAGDYISGNHGDGVYAVSIAVNQSFTEQNVLFGYHIPALTYVTGNHGDGIYLGTAAFQGSDAEQNDFVYNVVASGNHGSGLGIGAGANGYGFGSSYIYYSHVGQVVIAAYDSFDRNHGNGVSVSNNLYYGGDMNQTLEFVDVDMSHNGGAGFYETTHLTSIRGNSFSFSTNISSNLYLIGVGANHNGANGIDIRSYANGAVYAPAFFGGYNYMQFHNTIQGVTADNNGGSGLSMNTGTSGRYSLNAEYTTISGSEFDRNGGAGADFVSSDYYGPGGFGVSLQQTTISGSDFSHNGGDGIDITANSSGRQGRAEQHFTIVGSTMDHNGGDGLHIYASAVNGTYIATHPCDTVQGLPGGCAFVRQNVVVVGSDMSHNAGNGVFVGTYANNYGAIYGVSGRPHAPTLELYGSSASDNGGRGMDVSNHVSGNSYLYQYIANIDTTFDHNGSDGVYMASYVGGGSVMLQRALLYSYHTGASAHGNAGNGFKATIEALGGSYARDVNIVEGVDLNRNGSFGFDGAVAYADGSSTGLQINAVYFNAIQHNGDGIGLYSIGPGGQQISYIGDNLITGNAFVGVYGEANFGAFQYIGVYTFGNSVTGNGTNYLFNAFGGSTQILN
ncbi:MAG TPA: inverse autotransporter beta domain-containing protein [Rhizomicrobium sp.]|nr:inverse autotransporter beta domain-containing protein [Rhizomicrobium sp.]